nr:MAG TPA: hypothetical protein [Caudoviricetes sp.]
MLLKVMRYAFDVRIKNVATVNLFCNLVLLQVSDYII